MKAPSESGEPSRVLSTVGMSLELQGQSLASGSGVWPPVPSTPIKERHDNKTTEPGDAFDVVTMGHETDKGSSFGDRRVDRYRPLPVMRSYLEVLNVSACSSGHCELVSAERGLSGNLYS